jgi:hypothetical protein
MRAEVGKGVVEVVRDDDASRWAHPIELSQLLPCEPQVAGTKEFVKLRNLSCSHNHARHRLMTGSPGKRDLRRGPAHGRGDGADLPNDVEGPGNEVPFCPGVALPGAAKAGVWGRGVAALILACEEPTGQRRPDRQPIP